MKKGSRVGRRHTYLPNSCEKSEMNSVGFECIPGFDKDEWRRAGIWDGVEVFNEEACLIKFTRVDILIKARSIFCDTVTQSEALPLWCDRIYLETSFITVHVQSAIQLIRG